ncbi:MAG: HNH endonuclease [Actinomycetota bacterium]|nr:HNH endonuclease [Actinomycetota bacterium]
MAAAADRSLAAGAVARPHRDRHLVPLHVRGDGRGNIHLGDGLSQGLRRFLSCDARVRAVLQEEDGTPVSDNHSTRSRTGAGCRVPGCDRKRWLHVHHLRHWEDGGTTDTANLLALCQLHHRLHHRDDRGSPATPTTRPG